MAISFYLDTRPSAAGDHPVRISVHASGVRVMTSLGVKVSPDRWDVARQRAKRGVANSSKQQGDEINASLRSAEMSVEGYLSRCADKGVAPTKEGIRAAVRQRGNGKDAETVEALYSRYIIEEGRHACWAQSTLIGHRALRNNLIAWKPSAVLADIDGNGIAEFASWLINTRRILNSSADTKVKSLKAFLNWCRRQGLTVPEDTAQTPKLRRSKNDVIYLEWEELMRLMRLDLSDIGGGKRSLHKERYMEEVRDLFCFCCFTSLRFSDAQHLKWSSVAEDSIKITQIKTGKTVVITLNKYAKEILARRAKGLPEGKVFAPMHASHLSLTLPDLCRRAGIEATVTRVRYSGAKRIEEAGPKWQFVTSHTARRTFICNALLLGIPAEVVMQWTGHSQHSAMAPYIGATDKAKAAEMDKFNKR